MSPFRSAGDFLIAEFEMEKRGSFSPGMGALRNCGAVSLVSLALSVAFPPFESASARACGLPLMQEL